MIPSYMILGNKFFDNEHNQWSCVFHVVLYIQQQRTFDLSPRPDEKVIDVKANYSWRTFIQVMLMAGLRWPGHFPSRTPRAGGSA